MELNEKVKVHQECIELDKEAQSFTTNVAVWTTVENILSAPEMLWKAIVERNDFALAWCRENIRDMSYPYDVVCHPDTLEEYAGVLLEANNEIHTLYSDDKFEFSYDEIETESL